MAYTSFTIRRVTTSGDYLQYVPGASGPSSGPSTSTFFIGASTGVYLKADGIQQTPTLSDEITAGGTLSKASYFEAVATDYDVVDLSWGLTLYEVSGTEVRPYSVLLCYSPYGSPETIGEGDILLETRSISTFTHSGVPSPWSYYTLFVRFRGGVSNSDYYEPVARLAVLVPEDLNSSEDLYNKLPSYIRRDDETNSGDLKKYLSIFGWELDRTRTLIRFLMSMKDPRVANDETLEAISGDLGLGLSVRELGPSRLRGYLDNIGKIRKEKGTALGVTRAIEAIAGAHVELSTSKIYIYPHRTNFIKDPRFRNGVATSTPTTQKWKTFVDSGAASFSILETVPSASQTSGSPDTYNVNVIGGDVYYFSIHGANPTIQPNLSIESVAFYGAGGFSGGSASLIVKDTNPQFSSGSPYWRLEVPSTITSYTPVVLSIRYNNTLATYSNYDYALLEKQFIGEYFDGDTIRGGWLVDSGSSIADYRWLGTKDTSFSVYTTNYQKTKNVVYRLLPDVIPITQLLSPTFSGSVYSNRQISKDDYRYTIEFNAIPGVT